jgi:dTDP-4-dehydrorhamnose reductase
MRILILGSSGYLGSQLYKSLKSIKKIRLFHNGLKRKKIDLTKFCELKEFIIRIKPNLIINCSGIANVDICEIKKKISYKINVSAIKNIFLIKKKLNLNFFFFHFSTDHIYDNKRNFLNSENDKTCINNEYSKQKLMAEAVCENEESTIFRTNFFGKLINRNSFDNWIFNSFLSKKKFFLFFDQHFSPLRIKTICKIIKLLIIKKKFVKGIFNIGSKDGMSKMKFAIIFAKKTLIYNNYYIPSKINTICRVKRSRNMLLNVKKFEKTFNIKLPKLIKEIDTEIKDNY